MKSTKEILEILVYEIIKYLDEIRTFNDRSVYFNERLGDTSFILAGLLESLLRENNLGWDNRRWIDDSLISIVHLTDNELQLKGVMIWGIEDTTEQWTEPFSFDISLLKTPPYFTNFKFSFGDLNRDAITYEQFKDNREYWTIGRRNWKYIVDSDKIVI